MDYGKALDSINEYWYKRRELLGKEEVRHIADKDNREGKLLGVFTKNYFNRSKLIKASEVIYGCVFKTYQASRLDAEKRYPVWVVFSPSKKVGANPKLLEKVAMKLSGLDEKSISSKEERTLCDLVKKDWSEVSYFEVPSQYTDGELVYLSIIYWRKNTMPVFHLGLNLFLANQGVSKEIIFLPPEYWTREWNEEYWGEKKGE